MRSTRFLTYAAISLFGCDGPATDDSDAGTPGSASTLVCDPPAMNAACDARGHWLITLTSDPQTRSGPACASPAPSISVEVCAADSGALQTQSGTATVSADGCKLSLQDTMQWRRASENGTLTTDIELTISANEASGTFRWRSSGYCPSEVSGTAHAVRPPADAD